MKWLRWIFAISLLAPVFAAGEPMIKAGKPYYAGNGCPKNTVSITWAPNGLSFSIIYDQFIAELTAQDKRALEIKRCQLIVPMVLPKGMSVTVDNADFRGFVFQPATVKSTFRAAYGFLPMFPFRTSSKLAVIERKFAGELADDYILTGAKDLTSSNCGGLVYLMFDNVLKLKGKRGDEAQMTLDSIDGTGKSTFNVKLAAKHCRSCRH